MKKKLNIAIAIPTYNRLDKLKVAIEKIKTQELDDRFNLTCVISNIASQDGTSEFLENLKDADVKFVIWNKPEENIFVNWRRCAEAIPLEIDWVWFHGDDDYLTTPQAVKGLVDIIDQQGDEKLALIHICQARRSQKTGKMIRGNTFDLCNEIGYHELLGWMSSIVVRRDKFVPAIMRSTEPLAQGLKADDLLENKVSAYRHSAGFLEECIADDALFVDAPWVEPQDAAQTEESMKRWQESHEGERYFYVVDDILSMYERGLLQKKCRPMFFRYLTFSFWDRYAAFLLASIIQTAKLTDRQREHWLRLRKMADCFLLERDKKVFLQWYFSITSQVTHYEKIHAEVTQLRDNLIEQYKFTNSAVYPFEVLTADGNLLR